MGAGPRSCWQLAVGRAEHYRELVDGLSHAALNAIGLMLRLMSHVCHAPHDNAWLVWGVVWEEADGSFGILFGQRSK